MSLFKKIIISILSVNLATYNFSLASPQKSNVEEAKKLISEAGIKNLSLEEKIKGLSEMRELFKSMQVDLAIAEKQADGRFAIKFRNYGTLTVVGLALLMTFLDLKKGGPDSGGSVIVDMILVAALGVYWGVSSAYIYLTNDELHDIQNTIEELTDKMVEIEVKIAKLKEQQ